MGLKDKLANDGSPHSRLGGTFGDSTQVGQRTGGYSSIKASQLHAQYEDLSSAPIITTQDVEGEPNAFKVDGSSQDLDGKLPARGKYEDNTPEGVSFR